MNFLFFTLFQSIIGPLVQLPLFVSFFFAIRRMAFLPVESFKTGGYLWFQDLTLYDPFFVLPIICSFSMLASIEVIICMQFTATAFYMKLSSYFLSGHLFGQNAYVMLDMLQCLGPFILNKAFNSWKSKLVIELQPGIEVGRWFE